MQLGTRNGWTCLALLLAPSPSRDMLARIGGVMKNRTTVRAVYLYLVTAVAIIMALTGVIGSVSDALNMYVFRLIGADSMPSELASLLGLLSSVVVGAPVWVYHLHIIERAVEPSFSSRLDNKLGPPPAIRTVQAAAHRRPGTLYEACTCIWWLASGCSS